MRTEQAIVRHWQLVVLAYTVSLLVGAVPSPLPAAPPSPEPEPAAPSLAPTAGAALSSLSAAPAPTGGGKSAPVERSCSALGASSERVVWAATLRRVRSWRCPWAHLQRYWTRWSTSATISPPPELAALLAHVARSLPLEAPTTAPAAPT